MDDHKNEVPEGMIPVDRFAKQKGMDAKRAIEMVRDGFYAGQIIDGEWYVREEELGKGKQGRIPSSDKSIQLGKTPTLSIIFFVLALLSYFGGIILSAEFWPGYPGYGREWTTEAYALSITWFTIGLVQASLFVAIGQGLSYLHKIVENTSK